MLGGITAAWWVLFILGGNSQGAFLALTGGEVDAIRDFAVSGFHKASWSIRTQDETLILWAGEIDRQRLPGVELVDLMHGEEHNLPVAAIHKTRASMEAEVTEEGGEGA